MPELDAGLIEHFDGHAPILGQLLATLDPLLSILVGRDGTRHLACGLVERQAVAIGIDLGNGGTRYDDIAFGDQQAIQNPGNAGGDEHRVMSLDLARAVDGLRQRLDRDDCRLHRKHEITAFGFRLCSRLAASDQQQGHR